MPNLVLENSNGENLVKLANACRIKFSACDQYGYIIEAPDDLVAGTARARSRSVSRFQQSATRAADAKFGTPIHYLGG